jgi:hypothetical protein
MIFVALNLDASACQHAISASNMSAVDVTVFHAVAPVEEGNSIDHAGRAGPCNGSENAVALAVGNAGQRVGSALHRAYAHSSVHIISAIGRSALHSCVISSADFTWPWPSVPRPSHPRR